MLPAIKYNLLIKLDVFTLFSSVESLVIPAEGPLSTKDHDLEEKFLWEGKNLGYMGRKHFPALDAFKQLH